jgi:hypothetical protein
MVESPQWIPPDNDTNDPPPAQLLCENFYFASIEDRTAFHSVEDLPLGQIVMEADYPHADSHWPKLQPLIEEELGFLPADTVRQVCFETACQMYRFPHPPDELVESARVARADWGSRRHS